MAEKKTQAVKPRINLADLAFSGVMKAMYGLEEPLRNSGIEPEVRELVKAGWSNRSNHFSRAAAC